MILIFLETLFKIFPLDTAVPQSKAIWWHAIAGLQQVLTRNV